MSGQISLWGLNAAYDRPETQSHDAITQMPGGQVGSADRGELLMDEPAETQDGATPNQPATSLVGSYTSTISLVPVNFSPGGTDIISISVAAGVQNHAAVVATGNGSSVALYFDNVIGQIVGRTLSPTGALGSVVTLTTTGAQLDTNRAGDNEPVSAARLSNGNIVVTWSAGSSIYARIFGANLSPVTSEFVVGTPALAFYHEYSPDVAALANGDFVVAWQDLLGASESHIRVGRFTSTGAAVTSFTADAPSNLNDERPSIAGLTDGGYVIGFDRRDNAPTPGTQVYGAVYNADNSVRSAVAFLDGIAARDVVVAARPGGGFSFYYEHGSSFGPGTDINIITSTDGLLHPGQASSGTLNSPTNDHGVAAGFDSQDGYSLVLWTDTFSTNDHDVWGALLSPTGQIIVDATGLARDTARETASGAFWLDRATVAVVYESNAGKDAADKDGSVEMRAFGIVRTTTGTASNDTIDFTGDWFYNFVNAGDGNDIIKGGVGNDRLDGGSGVNQLYGGPGDDGYVVTTGTDTIVENAGEGDLDYVLTTLLTYTLPANVEGLQYNSSSTNAFTGIGNELDNLIYGGYGSDVLSGHAGNDRILGFSGNDRIDGGLGADTMIGGAGNDTYVVDNVGDVVVEQSGEGVDTVESSIDYTLGSNVENLTLTGTGDTNGTGNAGSNVLIGNSGNNYLNGGGGTDTFRGGAGDDVYIVDSADDLVIENAGDGSDLIKSSVSYTLAPNSNIESLRLSGSANINATGDNGYNKLVGNPGDNILDGGGGGDVLRGGLGNDTYIIRDATDRIVEVEGNGTDIVKAAVSYVLESDAWIETLRTFDDVATTALDLTGNAHTTLIRGNAGANHLTGGIGDEMLFGLGGADIFVFAASGVGHDTVGDFVSGTDKLDLSAFGFASFAAVQAATHNVGGSAVIDLGGGNNVTLTGFLSAQLQSGDVIISGGSGSAIELPKHAGLEASAIGSDDGMAIGLQADLLAIRANETMFVQAWMMPVL